jgi:hypothetical protein
MFLMTTVGPPTQNSILNFAAQGSNLCMLKVQLAGPSIAMNSYDDATIGDNTVAQETNDELI